MPCLCHLSTQLIYGFGLSLQPFANPDEEQAAFRACTATQADRAALLSNQAFAETALAQQLFQHPERRTALFPKDEEPNPAKVAAETALAKTDRDVWFLVPSADRVHKSPHLRTTANRLALPPQSFLRVAEVPGILVPSPELHLLLRARWLKASDLALLICSYCGGYQQRPDLPNGRTPTPALTSREHIKMFLDKLPQRVPGARRLRVATELAFDDALSPREAGIAMAMALDPSLGGPGGPRAQLNRPVALGEAGARLMGIERLRPDLYVEPCPGWPSAAVEYQSAEGHNDKEAGLNDQNRMYAFEDAGLTTLAVTPAMVRTPEGLLTQVHRIQRAVGLEETTVDPARWATVHQAWMTFRFVW